MSTDWQQHVERWIEAGLIDQALAARIRGWESGQSRSQGLRWPIRVAMAFGAILLGLGVLLFVSAHWDRLSPAQRMILVLLVTAVFHIGGAAAATRFESLSIALHAAGTMALGGGIALTGQIFHLSEHWPSAILLWGTGALAGWILLRQWPQAVLAGLLLPAWLAGEWLVLVSNMHSHFETPVTIGICALAITYLGARRGAHDSIVRKGLAWGGGIALFPAVLAVCAGGWSSPPSTAVALAGLGVAITIPLAAGFVSGGGDRTIAAACAILWSLGLSLVAENGSTSIATYAWCAMGAAALTAWGIRDARVERINLGIAGFGITVFAFYFSNVLDKLGRSASLMGAGLLFLIGGWLLQRTRRELISRIRPEAV